MIDLDKLDELEAQATPAPLNDAAYSENGHLVFDFAEIEDHVFLIALRNAYPAMSAELRRLRAENERLKEDA